MNWNLTNPIIQKSTQIFVFNWFVHVSALGFLCDFELRRENQKKNPKRKLNVG